MSKSKAVSRCGKDPIKWPVTKISFSGKIKFSNIIVFHFNQHNYFYSIAATSLLTVYITFTYVVKSTTLIIKS
jgi:hypothetical protein